MKRDKQTDDDLSAEIEKLMAPVVRVHPSLSLPNAKRLLDELDRKSAEAAKFARIRDGRA